METLRRVLPSFKRTEPFTPPNLESVRLDHRTLLVSINPVQQSEKQIYGLLKFDSPGPYVRIPLETDTYIGALSVSAYARATILGQLDPIGFHTYATDIYNLEPLIAHLNRQVLNVNLYPDDIYTDEIFLNSFSLSRDKQKGKLYIGSIGGGGSYSATIDYNRSPHDMRQKDQADQYMTFKKHLITSFGHLNLELFPLEQYKQLVVDMLRFLPEQWDRNP